MVSPDQNLVLPIQDSPLVLDLATLLVKNGEAEELARLLRCHELPPGDLKWLALVGSESRCLPILQVLIDSGWDINEPASPYEPPLLGCAIRNGANEEVVRWFLDHGADPNAFAGRYKITPLSLAAQWASVDIVQLLLDRGGSAETGDLIYYACCRSEDPNTLKLLNLLYERGAPINNALFEPYPDLIDTTDFTGSPLWNACSAGNTAAVRFLLEHGASPSKKPTVTDDLPLDVAKKLGHPEIVNMLLGVSAR